MFCSNSQNMGRDSLGELLQVSLDPLASAGPFVSSFIMPTTSSLDPGSVSLLTLNILVVHAGLTITYFVHMVGCSKLDSHGALIMLHLPGDASSVALMLHLSDFLSKNLISADDHTIKRN